MKKIFVWACMAFILCGLLVQISAYASNIPPTGNYSVGCRVLHTGTTAVEVADKCAAAMQAYWRTAGSPNCTYASPSLNYGTQNIQLSSFAPNGCGSNDQVHWTQSNLTCPASYTGGIVGGMCTGGPDPAVCTAGVIREVLLSAGTRTATGTTDMAAPTNVQGCATSLVELLGCVSSTSSPNTIMCRWRFMQTGATAGNGTVPDGRQPSTEPVTPVAEKAVPPFNAATGQGCPKGTFNMGTDSAGGAICGGSGSAPSTPSPPVTTVKPATSVTNGDGSVTETRVTERLNSDGSKTTVTETTTTATDGTKTTSSNTTTSAKPDGTTGKKDDTQEEKKSDFCKQNPYLNICQNSSVSGSCEVLSCTGDAISCAIAKQSAEVNCRGKKADDDIKASAQYVLGNQVLSGADPMQASYPSKANGSTYAMPSSLDNQGWLGGGSCFNDKSFTVQGKTIVIPFSSVCPYLVGLRYVLMVIAALVCFKMLSGVILRE